MVTLSTSLAVRSLTGGSQMMMTSPSCSTIAASDTTSRISSASQIRMPMAISSYREVTTTLQGTTLEGLSTIKVTLSMRMETLLTGKIESSGQKTTLKMASPPRFSSSLSSTLKTSLVTSSRAPYQSPSQMKIKMVTWQTVMVAWLTHAVILSIMKVT